MKNILSNTQLTQWVNILVTIVLVLVGLPSVLQYCNQHSIGKLAAVTLYSMSFGEYNTPGYQIYIKTDNRTWLTKCSIDYILFKNTGEKAIRPEDYSDNITIVADNNVKIYSVARCPDQLSLSSDVVKKIIPAEWSRKKENEYQANNVLINPQEALCASVIYEKVYETNRPLIVNARIPDVEFNYYNDLPKFAAGELIAWFHYDVLLSGIEVYSFLAIQISLFIIGFALVDFLYKAKYKNSIIYKILILYVLFISTISSESIVYYFFTINRIHWVMHPINIIIISILLLSYTILIVWGILVKRKESRN